MRCSLEAPISHMLNAFKALLQMYIVNLVVVPTLARDLVPRASHDHGKGGLGPGETSKFSNQALSNYYVQLQYV